MTNKHALKSLFLLIAFTFFFSGCTKTELPQKPISPPTNGNNPLTKQSKEITEVRPESSGELWRKTTHGGVDGKTVIKTQTARRDGTLEHKYYRDNGTLKLVTLENSSDNILKSRTTFEADGSTIAVFEEFHPNGNLQSIEKLGKDNKREKLSYYEDGTSLYQRITYKAGSTYEQESLERFRKNGTLAHSEKFLSDKSTEICNYYPDGKLYVKKVVLYNPSDSHSWSYRYYGNGYNPYGKSEVTVYAPDGQTVMVKSTSTSYSTSEALYYSSAGKLQYKRVFSYNGVETTIYDENEKAVACQIQRRSYGYTYTSPSTATPVAQRGPMPVDGYLEEVQLLDENGNWTKRIHLNNDQIREVWQYGEDNFSRTATRYYRSDGTLEKEEFNEDGKTRIETHEASENIREDINPDYLKLEPSYLKIDNYTLPEIPD